MDATELEINGAWLLSSPRHADNRGWFQEWFKQSEIFAACGLAFDPVQANIARSVRGTIRGIHYSTAPAGQAKLVTVMAGAIDDYVVDVRVGSPTFGTWARRRLSSENGFSLLLSAHLGHAYHALTDDTVVAYLTSAEYNPGAEHSISPFADDVAIEWDSEVDRIVSSRDTTAPTLAQQMNAGLLPRSSN